jgi:hypothetical protein
MLWRSLLTWHSLPCAHRICMPRRACRSHCTRSRTALTQSGRLAWMRKATYIESTTTVVGRTWHIMPSACFSCNTTLSASLQSSGVVLLFMRRRSRTLPRGSVIWPRRMVTYVSSSETWRVAFVTRSRSSQTITVVRLSTMRSCSGTVSF